MKTIITNKCKEYVLHAENGVKFQIKGYAFLVDREHLLSDDDDEVNKKLQLKDLYRKNPSINEELIVLNSQKNENADFLDRLFDLTYIPSLEVRTNNDYSFGTYNINLDIGINTKNQNGFSPSTYKCDQFDAILIIGQSFNEKVSYVTSQNKCFLAAILLPDGNEELSCSIDNPKITNIVWQFSILEQPQDDNNNIVTSAFIEDISSECYTAFSENASAFDNQTEQVSENVFLVPKPELNYDSTIHKISDSTDFTGKYQNTSIVLTDNTDKVGNIWNVSSTIAIFDNDDKRISKPQLLLSYTDNDKLIDSLAFTYSRNKNVFSINNVTGTNVQVNLFPENIEYENTLSATDIKKYNESVLSSWSALSGNSRFLKLNSYGSNYDDSTSSTLELFSLGNNIKETSSITFIDSNNNEIVSADGLTFLNADRNNINNLNDSIFIGSYDDNFGQDSALSGELSFDYTCIGTNGINTNITKPGIQDNINFIGDNTDSKIVSNWKDNIPLNLLNETQYIKGKYSATDSSTGSVEMNIGRGLQLTTSFDPIDTINYSLVGFNGLVANKVHYVRSVYPAMDFYGYSKELRQSAFVPSGSLILSGTENYEEYIQQPIDSTIVFGEYNAYSPQNNYYTGTYDLSDYLKKICGKNVSANNALTSIYKGWNSAESAFNVENIINNPIYNYMSFDNQQDFYFVDNPINRLFNELSADEGDISLHKILVVGAGEKYTDNTEPNYFTPAENVSLKTGLYSDIKRIDLFSIEQDSFQLTHNNTFDANPSLSATQVSYIPSMFAVRGWIPSVQQYHYRFTTGNSAELCPTLNKYQLQNSIYTPTGILIPLERSSNDGYKLGIKNINDYLNGNYIPGVNQELVTSALDEKFNEFLSKRTSFIFKTRGIKTIKGTNETWRYKIYIEDILDGLSQKGINISNTGIKGSNPNVYTIYLVNENPLHTLTFKGMRLRKDGNMRQTLLKTKYINPGDTQRIIYMDNGSNGKYGVMNLNYFNENNNTYFTNG